ncbi:hypothetical protein GH714_033582 [Hevea brasiliensis]|uniref:Disease resistance R13L4/SHOC-2-like LRR domain-containing protein n=1 Tax=Hevea brasiliensis TaxID=3981 RepID=A0A6A6M5M5_HEVBR|nr:hypothetical protein GH714_033403 [Hevea brasiliensis]KAF2307944.1 hypothetical protein GH714_033582 [Hevea brasiliensis]
MLALEDSKLEISPKTIGSLKHLRFLCFPERSVDKKVSKSICKLQNLQLLALRTEELGSDIRYLINLRFLMFSTKQKCLAKNGLGCLTSLRSLWIYECENLEYLCEDMQGLKHLRTLSIHLCKSLISLPQNLKYLTALETLAIADCENLNLTMEEGKDNQDLARFSLQNLNIASLQQLVIRNCDELSGRCERGQGEDWSKIAHIPNIFLDDSEISSTGN